MRNKFIGIIIAVCVVAGIVKLFIMLEPPQNKIKRIIYAVKTATEREQILRCFSSVSFSYRDQDGNDREGLFLIAKHVFETYDAIAIEIVGLSINILDKERATAKLVCFGQGERAAKGSFAEIDQEKVTFEIVFQKEESGWKVIELRFIEPEDFLRLGRSL